MVAANQQPQPYTPREVLTQQRLETMVRRADEMIRRDVLRLQGSAKRKITPAFAERYLAKLDPSHPGVVHREIPMVEYHGEASHDGFMGRPTCIHGLLEILPADRHAEALGCIEVGDEVLASFQHGKLACWGPLKEWREPSRGVITFNDCPADCPTRRGHGGSPKRKMIDLGSSKVDRRPIEMGAEWTRVPIFEIGELYKAGIVKAHSTIERAYLEHLASGGDPIAHSHLSDLARRAYEARMNVAAVRRLLRAKRRH